MNYYTVHYTYADQPEELDELRPTHRAFLASAPGMIACGPHVGTHPATALLVFQAESPSELGALLDGDPFATAGLITHRVITQWNPVLGILA